MLTIDITNEILQSSDSDHWVEHRNNQVVVLSSGFYEEDGFKDGEPIAVINIAPIEEGLHHALMKVLLFVVGFYPVCKYIERQMMERDASLIGVSFWPGLMLKEERIQELGYLLDDYPWTMMVRDVPAELKGSPE